MTSSHSETTVEVNSWYARDPREPANLGDIKSVWPGDSFLPFVGAAFQKKKKKRP